MERAFRSMKGMDIRVRPIRHFTEDRVRSHSFLCMLAFYVEWHLRKALGAPMEKKKTRETVDGFTEHSFETMMVELATRCRHACTTPGSQGMTFTMETEATPWQRKVLELPRMYPVTTKP